MPFCEKFRNSQMTPKTPKTIITLKVRNHKRRPQIEKIKKQNTEKLMIKLRITFFKMLNLKMPPKV